MIGEHDIVNITPISTCQEVYDFHVTKYENYFAGGLVHHNTTIGSIIGESTLFGKWPWSGKHLSFSHNLPRKVRYIGQDWKNQIEKVVLPEIRKWWPKNRPVKTRGNQIIPDAMWTDEKTGSTLEIMSNLQDSDVHEGWSGDLIIYDEPPKRDIRIANARGLIDRNGRELFCMTLLKEAWVDREVIKAMNKDGSPDMSVFNVNGEIWANVGYGITEEGIDQYAKTLTDDEKDARLRGVPSYMSGLVLPKFHRRTHLVDRFDVPLDWIIDIGIDVHPREKQAILFMATSPKGERFLCFEIFENGSGDWVGEQIIRVIDRYHYRVGRIIIDPLAKGDRNTGDTTFDKIDRILSQHGHVLNTASKDKESGIIDINKHLMGPNKQPSLFVFNDLKRTITEIEGWMYDEDTQKPQKKDDHMCENLYRLILENTTWYPMEEDQREEEVASGNKWTGY